PQLMRDLSGTKNYAIRPGDGIFQHESESSFRQIADRGGGLGTSQKAFGRQHHERLPPAAQDLPAEEMEILGRRRRLDHFEVVFGRELEEPLEARARVLGALAFVAVGKEQ